jgi:Fe-S cluster assembly protein SufD
MSQAVKALESAHRALAKECGKDAVHTLREGAMARFRELGFPARKDEEWRFTNVAPVAEAAALPLARPGGDDVSPDDVSRLAMDGAHGARLVFVDGHLRTDLSTRGELPEGVALRGLAEALADGKGPWSPHLARHAVQEDRPFVALNTAFLEDGAFLHVGKGVTVEEPIHLLYVSTRKACFPRNLILLEEGAAARVVETYASVGETAHLSVVVTETVVGKNADLDHYRIQAENERALHVSHCQVHQDRDSRYRSHGVTVGGRLTRNDIDAVLDEENISCTLNGLFLTHGTQHVDNHTRLLHKKAHCESHELYKGILDDDSTGVFSGKIHVFEDAQKTDAKQSSANLLLSDDAVVDAKPQLEIYADDVKCTHGATIGQLDESALFYLRTRGIPEAQARNILIRAFAGDITNRIRLEGVRERVDALLAERLPGG